MSSFTFVIYVLLIKILGTVSKWIETNSVLPYAARKLAAGFYNDTIYIFGGGHTNSYDLVQYHISTDTFTHIGRQNMTFSIFGWAQWFTQIADIMYMIEANGEQLSVFDMKQQQLTRNWKTIETDVSEYGCLSSSNDSLFISGGSKPPMPRYQYIKTLQVLNLTTSQWMESAPDMQQARGAHACIVFNDKLWVFGGSTNGTHYLQTNERIHIHNIVQQSWKYTNGSLLVRTSALRAVVLKDMVYILGGKKSGHTGLDTVYMLDAESETLIVSEPLSYGVAWPAVICTSSSIFVIGGYRYSRGDTDELMYYRIEDVPVSTSDGWLYNNSEYISNTDDSTSTSDGRLYNNSEYIRNTDDSTSTSDGRLYNNSEYIRITDDSTNHSIVLSSFDEHSNTTLDTDVTAKEEIIMYIAVACILALFCGFLACAIVLYFRHKKKKKKNGEENLKIEEVPKVLQEAVEEQCIVNHTKQDLENVHTVKSNDVQAVKLWLESEVKLPFYYENFVCNGYERIDIIKDIQDKFELQQIGIVSEQHCMCILKYIAELNEDDDEHVEYEVEGAGTHVTDIVDQDTASIENRKREGSRWDVKREIATNKDSFKSTRYF